MNARSRRRGQPRSRLQLDAPIQPVAPGFVQVIGREAAAMFLELPARRPDRRDVERHPRLFGGPPALFEIARRAGGDDLLPRRTAALRAGDDMLAGETPARPAILDGELCAQGEIEYVLGGELGR